MFIESLELENLRTFTAKKTVEFVHPDRKLDDTVDGATRLPKLNNVNLLFGNNASGKTTMLEAIALVSLGPTIEDARISPRPLVRFAPSGRKASKREQSNLASIRASIVLQGDEWETNSRSDSRSLAFSELSIQRKGELEKFEFSASSTNGSSVNWGQAYKSDNSLFFVAAYGATRRVEQKSDFAISAEKRSSFVRANRLESVMREGYPLTPLRLWFAQKKKGKRRDQIIDLINRLLGKGHFTFEGERDNDDDFLFSRNGMDIPSRSLSDGYRGFIGWITDLIYHLDFACPDQKLDLTEVNGIVLVDEIDLHLHPEWQMVVIERIAKAFPRIQFIFTSHSPLIAGSVEWMNIKHLHLDNQHRTGVDPFRVPIHGLDADQILLTSLFGLKTTRAKRKVSELAQLRIKAISGDDEAARQLMWKLAEGMEDE